MATYLNSAMFGKLTKGTEEVRAFWGVNRQ